MRMKIWKNTKTLDNIVPLLCDTVAAAEAEIAVIGSKNIDLLSMPKLRKVFKCGVGVDNIKFEEFAKRGIELCLPSETTANYIYEETANFTVFTILNMLYTRDWDLCTWRKSAREFLGSREVLVVGLGNIGSRVAQKLEPLINVRKFDLELFSHSAPKELFKSADVVTLHIPLVQQTRQFVDSEKLGWMKDGGVLVNTSRGDIVDEAALFQEIESGRLRAAFDVFWEEPYVGRLKRFHPERFLMTPHIASSSVQFLEALAEDFRQFVAS